MRLKGSRSRGAVVLCTASLFVAACGSSSSTSSDTTAAAAPTTAASTDTTAASTDTTAASTDTTAAAVDTTVAAAASLVPDNGPCDTSKPEVELSIQTTFESAILTLKPQVDGAVAAGKAFNARGGVGGRCLKITGYDDKADPNVATDNARKVLASNAVASVNDTTFTNNAAVADIYLQGNYPRVAVSPNQADLAPANVYNLGGGGTGTTFEMLQSLIDGGYKKVAVIHVDIPDYAALTPLLNKIAETAGVQMVADIPVPAGTTNYDQFVIAAEDAGADAVMMPLGGNESVQVMQAAAGLDTKLFFAVSLGTFGQKDIAGIGDIAKNMIFNAEVPPASIDTKQFPAMEQIVKDLSASGDAMLQRDTLQSSAVRSWLAVYAFVTVMDKTDTANITRESVTAAFNAAKDIDMLGLQKPWTPNAIAPGGVFPRISNPNYYFATWDGTNFKTTDAPTGDLLATLKPTGLAG